MYSASGLDILNFLALDAHLQPGFRQASKPILVAVICLVAVDSLLLDN